MKFRKKLLNKKSLVLFENKLKQSNKYFGRDEYSNSVIVESSKDIKGKIIKVLINGANQNTLFGEIDDQLVKKEFAA